MRIAFDAKRAFCNNTGLGNYSRTITRGLAEKHPDMSITLITPKVKSRHKDFCAGLANVKVVQPKGVWRHLGGFWRTFGIGLDSDDIYHGLSQELPLLIPKGVHTVVTIHDMMPWRFPENFHLFDRMVYKLKVRRACRVAHSIVAISRQTRDDIVQFLHIDPRSISVIYQSCEPIFRKPVTAEQRSAVRSRYNLPGRYIVSIGTIERRKNQATLVESMLHIDEGVSLVIVGRRTNYANEVDEAIRRNGLEQRVRIISDARFEDFPALYAEAEAAAYISLFEGFGIPVLEAMCSGTAVVTSGCSSMPEVGGDAVLYADPTDAMDVALKINSIISNNSLRQELLDKSRQQTMMFLPESTTEELYRLYRDLVE